MKTKPPVPREHGAWALLYGPFAVAAVAFGRFELQLILLFFAMTALFLAQEPLSRLWRLNSEGSPGRRHYWRRWCLRYLIAGSSAGVVLILHYRLWYLIPLALLTTLFLLAQLYLISHRRERSIAGQLLGVVGLTASGPAACYVCLGTLDIAAFAIWSLGILYFASGIFYVRMRITRFAQNANPRRSVNLCAGYHGLLLATLALLAITGWIPWLAAAAFLPILIRAFWGIFLTAPHLNLKRIGYTEVAYTACFVLVLAVAIH